ncbi:MAG: methyl-accepting chemotaxis protein [Candidatus Omnitrophica bacterium]|nr:methyl-accepting chemotaxis protein [Candidatus Omnitrophota bacterium]
MKNMRKRFFIDKPFQSRYGIYVAVTLLIVCGISLLGLYFGIWGSVIESFSDEKIFQEIKMAARIEDYEHSRMPTEPEKEPSSLRLFREVDLLSARQREILQEILIRANNRLLPQALILIVLIGFGSIYLTHKIAGPLYRFRKSFEAVKNGELNTRVRLRKNDEGMSVADAFNEMMQTLDTSIGSVKKKLRDTGPSDLKAKLEPELAKFKTSNA